MQRKAFFNPVKESSGAVELLLSAPSLLPNVGDVVVEFNLK